MLFAIEDALIEVGDAPAQWDVVVEEVREVPFRKRGRPRKVETEDYKA